MLGGDGLGIPPQGSTDNWHRTPGSKMGNKPATSSWPPGEDVVLCYMLPKGEELELKVELVNLSSVCTCILTQYLYISEALLLFLF